MSLTLATSLGEPNLTSILFFFAFVSVTMGITWWAARKTKTASEFLTAGGNVTALQNGFALAGDYMSAASFLGIAGLVATSGFDGLIYSVGWLVGWPAVTARPTTPTPSSTPSKMVKAPSTSAAVNT